MQISQLNRDNGDVIVAVYKNVDGGGSVTTGMGVCYVQAGASIDGVSAVRSTAGTWAGFGGIARTDVAINDFGIATVWGYAASVLVSAVGTSITITRGDVLKPGARAGSMFSSIAGEAISTLLYKYVYAATTNDFSTTAWISGVVRAI